MEYIPRRARRENADAAQSAAAAKADINTSALRAQADESASKAQQRPTQATVSRESSPNTSAGAKRADRTASAGKAAPTASVGAGAHSETPSDAQRKPHITVTPSDASGKTHAKSAPPKSNAAARHTDEHHVKSDAVRKTGAAPKKPAAKPQHPNKPLKKRKVKLDPRLRRISEASAALRVLCGMALLLIILLWPRQAGPDVRYPRGDRDDEVILPIDVSTPAPTEAPTPEPTPASVTISAAGDCTLGYDPRLGYENSLPHELERQDGDYGYFFRGVLPVFESDDITLVNLECAFTRSNDRVEGKTYCFKGDPSYYNMLLQGDIEVVSLGNNHTYDYHQAGFDDTIAALEEAGIGYAVNGKSYITDVNGIRMGFLSYRNHTPELSALRDDIRTLRNQACDLVICSFHWGEEYRNVANSDQRTLGRAAVDYGADLVIGHHPHVIGSIEYYKGVYIVYSLGNFCFGGNRNPPDKDSFIFRQTFTMGDDGLPHDSGITIVPCRVSSVTSRNDYQPTIYGEEDAKRVLSRLNEYSRPLDYGIRLTEEVLQWEW